MNFSLFKKALTALVIFGAGQAQAITISASNDVGAAVKFNGDSTFNFTNNGSGDGFKVTSGGASSGFKGTISGTFTIGAGPSPTSVTSSVGALLTIKDGATPLTALIDWIDISTFGTTTSLNNLATINLGTVNYTGTNADLIAFRDGANPTATLSITWSQITDVNDLRTKNLESAYSLTLYNATTNTPDGGSTLAMVGGALLATGILRRKLKA